MGFTVNLITGMGEYLHAENVGNWFGPYGANDVALTAFSLPASPNKGVAITPYPVTDSGGTDSVVALQFRVRGGPGDRQTAADILDRLFDTLHDLEHVTIRGIPIVRIWRQSQAYIGTDANNRQEHSANYYIQLTRTGTHRED